jgi:hypothetical protein
MDSTGDVKQFEMTWVGRDYPVFVAHFGAAKREIGSGVYVYEHEIRGRIVNVSVADGKIRAIWE